MWKRLILEVRCFIESVKSSLHAVCPSRPLQSTQKKLPSKAGQDPGMLTCRALALTILAFMPVGLQDHGVYDSVRVLKWGIAGCLRPDLTDWHHVANIPTAGRDIYF